MHATLRLCSISLTGAVLVAGVALAGVFNGAGYYVAVYSTYAVSGSMSKGSVRETYHGPIEGPFETEEICKKRLKVIEREFRSRPKRVGDGSALFMCYYMDKAMPDDSGEWWNPRQDD